MTDETQDPEAQVPEIVLPGEAEADESLIDQAVDELNRRYAVKGLETMRAIGEYVIQYFFDGDPDNFREKGKKHVSFRELAKHPNLRVSYNFIWNAVSVVDQMRLLPENIAEALPPSHHKLLLPIKSEKKKVALAEKAVEKGLSKRDLEKEVAKVREKEKGDSRAGRPPLPAFVKGLTRLKKAVDLAVSDEIGDDVFDHFKIEDAKELMGQLDEQIVQLTALKQRVHLKIAEQEAEAVAKDGE